MTVRAYAPLIRAPSASAGGVAIFGGRVQGAMATLGGAPVFRVGFSVAMLPDRVLPFSPSQHAHTSVGMPPGTTKVRAKEFAVATEDGHAQRGWLTGRSRSRLGLAAYDSAQ